jgi:hypothetical protein
MDARRECSAGEHGPRGTARSPRCSAGAVSDRHGSTGAPPQEQCEGSERRHQKPCVRGDGNGIERKRPTVATAEGLGIDLAPKLQHVFTAGKRPLVERHDVKATRAKLGRSPREARNAVWRAGDGLLKFRPLQGFERSRGASV